ncbi:Dolichyl-phosphate-mannose-protein mannosyltransferase [Singulisphaera sp. GP187]|uniref:glycosyltransferase family 39 protein n=1 Tax=Singulisphaera sp. GP187 TaxID=1882752 RepID=UPI000929CE66|nr:glycosyltransferase family 39 protein [Singulisphaera sp. GP187]SIO61845.1 Dolichyl-phosphate-mannose-protein mannosyltransferase [Singulisphaera sp. GP187]
MTNRRALWTIIGVSSVLRLVWAANLGSYTNEAYYYLYAQNLAWGYFDHPPMVGFVAALGLGVTHGLSPAFGLRVGFIAMFAGSTWLMARLTTRSFGERAGVMAALILNVTVFYGMVVGTLAGPDGPLLFFWLLTLERLGAALEAPEQASLWVGAGFAWGAAMLSKYYAALLPVGFLLYLVLKPSARRCLRMPGPYLAIVEGLALFSPVIGWNAEHGWASFAFQGNRAGGFQGFQPELFLEAILGQCLYLTPWIWIGLVAILARLIIRRPRDWSESEAFLISQAVPALAIFMGVATFRRIMPHWPLIGFVSLMPLMGKGWAEQLAASPRRTRWRLRFCAAVPLLVGTLFVIHARSGLFQNERGQLLGSVWPVADPTVDTIRWGQIARELKIRGLLDDPVTFLFTDSWRFSAELAIVSGREVDVACYHRDARSFRFWSRPRDWVGRDGIFIQVEDSQVQAETYVPWFTRVEPIATFPIVRAGIPVETVRLYRCVRQTAPFQFGYTGPGPMPRPGRMPAPEGEPTRMSRHLPTPKLR